MENNAAKIKYFIYARKSTDDTKRQITSIQDQINTLKSIAEKEGLTIIGIFEEAKTAKKPGRPTFNDMLARIERGEANGIFAWDFDRISRNPIDEGRVRWLLQQGVLQIIRTPYRQFYPDDAGLLVSVEGGRANDYVIRLAKNVKRRFTEMVTKEERRPGPAPVGYLNIGEPGSKSTVPDPERFHLIKRLFEYALTGQYTVRQLRQIANKKLRIRTRKTKLQGGKPLSLSHIYKILTDPFYYGWFWWKNPETGIPELYKGGHKPMITEEEHRTIRAIIGRKQKPQPKKHLFPYTALITCSDCGSAITAEEKWQIICPQCKVKFASQSRDRCPKCELKISQMENKTLLHYIYYHCTKKKNPACTQLSVRVEDLEAQIDEVLKRFNISEKYMQWALATLQDDTEEELSVQKSADRSIERERNKLKEELAELNKFIIKQENAGWTLMSKEDALAEKNRIMAALNDLEQQQKKNNQRAEGWFERTVKMFDYASRARFWLREGTVEQRRDVLAALGSNITLKDQKLIISLTYPLPEIKYMLEVAPEMAAWFEPAKMPVNKAKFPPFEERIPTLLRGQDSDLEFLLQRET